MSNSSEYGDKKYQKELSTEINRIRTDKRVSNLLYGELIDNSLDWGKADNLNLLLSESQIILSDDGMGIPLYDDKGIELLKYVTKFGKPKRIIKENTIGKHHIGLKEGSIIVGNKLEIYTKNDDGYWYIEADWAAMSDENTYEPSVPLRKCNNTEMKFFTKYLGTTRGTIIKISNLLNSLDLSDYHEICDYCSFLYSNKMRVFTLNITYNAGAGVSNTTTKIIKPKDPCMYDDIPDELDSFKKIKGRFQDIKIQAKTHVSSRMEIYYNTKKKQYIIYDVENENENDNQIHKLEFQRRKKSNWKKINLNVYNEDKESLKLFYTAPYVATLLTVEQHENQVSTLMTKDDQENNYLSGFYIYRKTRLVCTSPLKTHISQSDYRSTGVRIEIYLPANIKLFGDENITKQSDHHWTITQLKNIEYDNMIHSHEYSNQILKRLGNKWSKRYNEYRGGEKIVRQNKIDKYIENNVQKPIKYYSTKINSFNHTVDQLEDFKKGHKLLTKISDKFLPIINTKTDRHLKINGEKIPLNFKGSHGTQIKNLILKDLQDTLKRLSELIKVLEDKQKKQRKPTTKQPTTKQPTTKQPTTKQPTTKQPTTKQPTIKQPTIKQPTIKQPTTKQPTIKQPTTTEPTTKQPTTKQPTIKQPTTKQPTTKQPITKQPTTTEPITKQPTTTNPKIQKFLQKINFNLKKINGNPEDYINDDYPGNFEENLSNILDITEKILNKN
jgi:hypothetical protein